MTTKINEAKHNVMPFKHVGIYARVSTAESKQLHSLSNQVGGLFDVVAADPIMKLYDVYVDVGSGRKARKNLGRLIEDCKAGEVDYILVKSVSRMYRDVVGLLELIRQLKELNVNVHFQNDNIDSISCNGELTITLIEAIAQAESDAKSMNIKWGLEKAKANPRAKINNRIIYGYRHEEGKLVVKDEEAEVIRFIYKLYLDGLSVLQIIEELYEKGIPSPKGNNRWAKETIRKILKDERYTGLFLIEESRKMNIQQKNNYPAIISRVMFNTAQLKSAERSNMIYNENGERVRAPKKYSNKKIK